ncbi:hypothetical protein ODJ79_43950 [Actinoplanes sp. KI2]|uniref:hypothetical protein n=1 Tax=Actinoplanes sp. KI2 TaxID=2983315 RepID=UPI0021D56CAF|nr:hypothetical protein [Actinoplanes sp. KI2]MCU7730713.1 hypothetical protein [Actinoplanes sp. KI2]
MGGADDHSRGTAGPYRGRIAPTHTGESTRIRPDDGSRSHPVGSYAPAVEYGVSADLALAAGASDLDPLQAQGAGSLLDRLLNQVEAAETGDEDDIVVVSRYWVGAHPEGALVLLVLDAASLEVAEAAARDIMHEVLERSELLADWVIARCEVGFDQRFAEAGLQAADGPDVPPADPSQRARWLAEQRGPATSLADPGPPIDRRQWVIDHAGQLRAFDLLVFDAGDGDQDTPKLAAGALIFASTIMIDELFQDIGTLAADHGTVAGSDALFMVLDELPQRFAHHYNGRFARQFLVATVMVTGRLAGEGWTPPSCVGEALALHLLVEKARALLEDYQLLDGDVLDRLYDGFDDAAYDDLDHEWLYQDDLDGFEDDAAFTAQFGPSDMHIEAWFQHIPNTAGHIHPFSISLAPPELRQPPDAQPD